MLCFNRLPMAALYLFAVMARAATPGPVASFPFDEGAGTTTADASGGPAGEVRNAVWTASGEHGSALVFDGSTSYVDLSASQALQISGSMTLEAWVYIAGTPGDDAQIIAYSDDQSGWQLKTTPDTGVRTFGVAVSSAGSHTQRYSRTVPEPNRWYYVAGVYDAAAQTLDIYVNGVLDNGILQGIVPASQTLPGGVSAAIGRRSGGYYFDGTIDDVRVYDRALTATEIQSDMNTAATASVPGSLVASYSFSEGSGTVTADGSGNQNSGTLRNAEWTASGKAGSGLVFDGSTSYVDLGAPPALQMTGSMTLEAWVYITGDPPDDGQIVAMSDDASGWQLKTTPDSGVRTFGIAVSPDGFGHTQRYGNAIPAANQWYQVAGVYDAAAQTLDLYVNGALDNGPLRGAVGTAQTVPSGVNATIGRRAGGYYFNGTIDEVRIYNRALTQSEIQNDMNAAGSGVTAPAPGSQDTEPPAAPTGLTAAAVNASQINLAWTPSTDNVGVAGYRVFRDSSVVGTTASTSYVDSGLSPNTAYSYTVAAFDAAGNVSALSQPATATTPWGSSPASPPPPSQTAFPLSVSSNRRYLVDRNGAPFLIQGDSPQTLIGKASLSDADLFFTDRQALGFNAVWVNLLCNSYTACNADGSTFDGIPPFTTEGDLATPNEAYFQRADAIINLAAQHGILVILDPIETGGWLPVLRDNGVDKAYNYGVYLGNRYKDFPNILWMSGNDFQTWTSTSDDDLVLAVARGIRSVDANHIHTLELNYYASTSTDDPAWAPLISLNAAYTYFPTYAEVLRAYNQPDTMPAFLVEANYEFEQNYSDRGTPLILRRQEYWSALSGSAGQLYASHDSYSLATGWQSSLDTVGAIQFSYLKTFLSSRPWYDLIPDQDHWTVTAGYGTFSSGGTMTDDDYVTAARTPSGSLVLAYMPTARTIAVDMSRLSGPVTAQWFDPSNGSYAPAGNSPLPNSGTMYFAPPGSNSAGDGDWVLVLEAAQ